MKGLIYEAVVNANVRTKGSAIERVKYDLTQDGHKVTVGEKPKSVSAQKRIYEVEVAGDEASYAITSTTAGMPKKYSGVVDAVDKEEKTITVVLAPDAKQPDLPPGVKPPFEVIHRPKDIGTYKKGDKVDVTRTPEGHKITKGNLFSTVKKKAKGGR